MGPAMKVLFGVFDWGIGHATRDIPLITELLKANEVHILSTGRALKLLKDYFTDRCVYYDVPSVYPPYTRTRFFKVMFALFLPKMIRNLQNARKKSREIVAGGFDKVISDCRYDVYDTPDNSYLINHQLRFSTPFGVEKVLERGLEWMMQKYKYVIVPDFEEQNLSGRLSHNLRYINKDRIKYIGILSHLKKLKVAEDIDCLISVSGPEPQRTVLQKKMIEMSDQLEGNVVIAGGVPESTATRSGENLRFYSFLSAERQADMMNRARFIISRPGYTTVMELAELNKKRALFLPTPGQTEQEYLAGYYEKQGYFHSVSQYNLQLQKAIEDSKKFKGFNPLWKTEQSVQEFIKVVVS
jgi:UDP-N-acetylglucosamine transferase subunit ALG13